ncbi:MAG: methylated-DNA--[protein]-cysteine S-methyltransferase, partial [bacterium]|nr:methylated-DNA--[protein]-cysteine S-methyltransferase [bacterium]
MMRFRKYESPLGVLVLAGDEGGLRRILFPSEEKPAGPAVDWRDGGPASISETAEQLDAYFAGELREFDLRLAPEGTPFQLEVWRELERIPYGETISYGELAARLDKPKASRAVGAANGRNPLPIVIPCHRVIGGDGKLTGYGGGVDIKRKLLDLEQGLGEML